MECKFKYIHLTLNPTVNSNRVVDLQQTMESEFTWMLPRFDEKNAEKKLQHSQSAKFMIRRNWEMFQLRTRNILIASALHKHVCFYFQFRCFIPSIRKHNWKIKSLTHLKCVHNLWERLNCIDRLWSSASVIGLQMWSWNSHKRYQFSLLEGILGNVRTEA